MDNKPLGIETALLCAVFLVNSERLWDMTDFTPTRAAGIAAMHDFVPAMGKRYADGRNPAAFHAEHHVLRNAA